MLSFSRSRDLSDEEGKGAREAVFTYAGVSVRGVLVFWPFPTWGLLLFDFGG